MDMQFRILLVDNDKSYTDKLSIFLKENRFQVYTINSGIQAIDEAKRVLPHIVLSEIEIPDIDGIELCQSIRETPELSNIIISFLTNQTLDYIQVAAFKAGCDDFIVKTIKPRVLIYRIMALLKRNYNISNSMEDHDSVRPNGTLYIDTERFIVVVDNKQINLPKKQFLLLQLLASHPTKVFTRNSIFEFIWGKNHEVGVRTIDVYIRKIREQIGVKYIKTIKGVGYRFE